MINTAKGLPEWTCVMAVYITAVLTIASMIALGVMTVLIVEGNPISASKLPGANANHSGAG